MTRNVTRAGPPVACALCVYGPLRRAHARGMGYP